MLTHIRLENFKSWRELDIDLGRITILFGTNSSGKTSVLNALLLLKQSILFEPLEPINLGGEERDYVDLGSYKDIVFKHDTQKEISVSLTFDDVYGRDIFAEKVVFDIAWKNTNEQTLLKYLGYRIFYDNETEDNVYIRFDDQDNHYRIEATERLFTRNLSNQPYRIARKVGIDSHNFWNLFGEAIGHHEPDLQSEINYEIKDFYYLGPLRHPPKRTYAWTGTYPQDLGSEGEKTIAALLAAERDHESKVIGQVADWLKKMGIANNFQMHPIDSQKRYYEPRIKIAGENTENALRDVGFGVSQILPVITLLFFVPEGSIVLLEQPELHLHPSAQSHLADLFLKVAEERNLQLIIESHSEHLLRRLQRRIAEQEYEFATPEHIKMYFCEPGEDGSMIRPVEVDTYGQIRNYPENFFGDLSGDLDAMTDAALERRRQELTKNG